MTKISLLFVEKLANNPLLASFSASISKILAYFSFATDSCKGLLIILVFLLTACSTDNNTDLVKQGEELFNKKHLGKNKVIGCVLCHSIKPSQVIVGPSLSGVSIRAKYLVLDQSAKDYLTYSITNPDAYLVEGYLPSTMYRHYSQELSPDEIQALVEYLLTL